MGRKGASRLQTEGCRSAAHEDSDSERSAVRIRIQNRTFGRTRFGRPEQTGRNHSAGNRGPKTVRENHSGRGNAIARQPVRERQSVHPIQGRISIRQRPRRENDQAAQEAAAIVTQQSDHGRRSRCRNDRNRSFGTRERLVVRERRSVASRERQLRFRRRGGWTPTGPMPTVLKKEGKTNLACISY